MKAKAKGKAVTWEELANLYDEQTGQCARVRPLEEVFKWAKHQPDKFYVDDDGVLHLK